MTPTTEIIRTIQVVQQMQSDLKTLAKVVEAIGERLVKLEDRLNAAEKS